MVSGLFGVLVGLLGMLLVAHLAKWPTTVPPQWIAIAVAFSALVGIFFGCYPARKASRLNPIDALRFE